MTHFPAIFKALFSRRFKRVTATWLLALILLVGVLVFTWFFQHDSFPQTRRAFFGGLVVVAIVAGGIGDIVLLAEFAFDDQKLWTRPVWRALPTRSWYLVFGSLLADLGAFLLFWVGILAVMFSASIIGDSRNFFAGSTPALWRDFFIILGIWTALHLFIWVFVSMVHMLSLSIVTFLPDRNARLLRVGVNLLLAVLALYVVGLVSHPLFFPIRYLINGTPSGLAITTYSLFYLVALSIILSIINLVLFDRWVEAEV